MTEHGAPDQEGKRIAVMQQRPAQVLSTYQWQQPGQQCWQQCEQQHQQRLGLGIWRYRFGRLDIKMVMARTVVMAVTPAIHLQRNLWRMAHHDIVMTVMPVGDKVMPADTHYQLRQHKAILGQQIDQKDEGNQHFYMATVHGTVRYHRMPDMHCYRM